LADVIVMLQDLADKGFLTEARETAPGKTPGMTPGTTQ
jgi:hypothetical protein